MPRKKQAPKIEHRKLGEDEKHLAMGKAVYNALDGYGSVALTEMFSRGNKLLIGKLASAITCAVHEAEETERRPGEQWRGSNVHRSAL